MPIFGIDVSAYQTGIDLAQVVREGFDFCAVKVTEGASYRSPAWAAQRDGARAAGLILYAYHFVTNDDPAGQAANCAAHLGDPGIPVALDWESGGGDWPNFLRVLAAFRAAGLRVVLAYAPHWYWAAHGCPDVSVTGLPLWSSHYPTTTPGDARSQYGAVADADWAGYGGAPVALLQFSDSASHVGGFIVDASAFRGSRDELTALLHAAPTAVATPVPAPPGAPSPRTGEDPSMYFVTDPPPDGAAKVDWPTRRISFGFDPPFGWGGRCAIKLHFAEPGGWIHQAIWWVRPPAPGFPGGGVGMPNAPHSPVGISLDGQAERFVGLGWEIVPPECADELDIVLSAPGGVHIFPVYER